MLRLRLTSLLIPLGITLLTGCQENRSPEPPKKDEVVVYTSVDEEFSKPVLTEYRETTNTEVLTIFDTESTKAFGLAGRIIAEAGTPGCDLFWNNEILNTLRLKQKGLLQPFHPKNADDYPPQFKARDATWYGFAARARILIVNTDLLKESERPKSIHDLTNEKWKGKIGIAKPLFGTTGTQAACLFAKWGEKPAQKFFLNLKANDAQILQGNKQVAMAVGGGKLAFGLTDTDDAMGEIAAGSPVAIIYPDREPDQLGTLFIPNTLALIKHATHPDEAEELANFLLSPEVESELAESTASQIPLNPKTPVSAKVETPQTVHAMDADFEKAAQIWETQVAPFLAREFASAQ